MKTENSIIYSNVQLGKNTKLEEFCLIGIKTKNCNKPTSIGKDSFLRSGTYIYAGNKIGSNFQTGNKVNIREENEIGNNVSIGTQSVIEHHVKIGNNVRIHSNVFIPEFTILKSNVWIGPNVVLTNAKYPNRKETKENLSAPVLMENCIIGANVTILPNIKIGKNAIIGAGSVVTKNIQSNTIVFGNPAKKFKLV